MSYTVSCCITVLNEGKTIGRLLDALARQTVLPDEVIIIDGGSTDDTIKQLQQAKVPFPLIVLIKKGNRSIGRNFAIETAKSDWIAVTDAGCVPETDWLEQLIKTQQKSGANVVAGFYRGAAETSLQQAMVPYVLVMPDRVNETTFLPATRSMLIHRHAWETVGKFDEALSDNEDYPFARNIARHYKIAFARAAVVAWLPRQNLRQFWWMIFRFAKGDMSAGIIRPKVAMIFARYILAMLFLFFCSAFLSPMKAFSFGLFSLTVYLFWSIRKNARYVSHAWPWLPVLQIISDAAVMTGSVAGMRNHRKSHA